MKIMESVRQTTQYLLEAMARLFSPSDDSYPATGAQPYYGEPNHDSGWND